MKLPDYVIEEIAARRALFFLGAGASAASTSKVGNSHPPQWSELLDLLRKKQTNRTVKNVAAELLKRGDYLGAAEVLCDAMPKPDFHNFLVSEFQKPDFGDNDLVNAIHELDPKIVITTNYDLVYEGVCSEEIRKGGMKTKTYRDKDVISAIRSKERIFIYSHGCIKNPADCVLTASQYYDARLQNPGFFSLLESLFMTNTVIFVGYSLGDPDIQLLLESNSLKIKSDRKHFLIIERGHHTAIIKSLQTKYDIEIIEYKKGHHEEVHQYFSSISSEVESMRQRGL